MHMYLSRGMYEHGFDTILRHPQYSVVQPEMFRILLTYILTRYRSLNIEIPLEIPKSRSYRFLGVFKIRIIPLNRTKPLYLTEMGLFVSFSYCQKQLICN
jgi:hypothetical protein